MTGVPKIQARKVVKNMGWYLKTFVQYKCCGVWRYNEPGRPSAVNHLVAKHDMGRYKAGCLIDDLRRKTLGLRD